MKIKPIVTRHRADNDADDAFDFYLIEAGVEIAIEFIDDLERAFHHISRHPLAGSTRYGEELMISGIRYWPMKRFPYPIFYVEKERHIEIARVLHTSVDAPSWLQDEDVE